MNPEETLRRSDGRALPASVTSITGIRPQQFPLMRHVFPLLWLPHWKRSVSAAAVAVRVNDDLGDLTLEIEVLLIVRATRPIADAHARRAGVEGKAGAP